MKQSYLKLLNEKGFSIIPCSEDKRPIGKWKQFQEVARTNDEIESLSSPLFGLITGFDFLEVVDIDLKVLSTAREQKEWWDEYIGFLRDNILDFDEKFVIKKTYNNGFHILYKSKRVQGNTKIAKLKGHNEAIIESRGIGGMVIVYDKTFGENNYQHIKFISDEDREILWECSKYFNYIKPKEQIVPSKEKKQYETKEGDTPPWEDFNNKNKVWDVISSDFEVVKNLNKKYVIKRHNAESAHSGYIYKDEDLMFLFSTGTIYENEKQYTAWSAYVRKNHNDDFSAAASQAYKDGYGTRLAKKEDAPKVFKEEIEKLNKNDLVFPIKIFPEEIQGYLLEASRTLNLSIDYMGCSLLWMISVCIGNSLKIEIIPGWNENATVWMSIVGKPGWGKTPSIKRIISPLEKLNSRQVKKYYEDLDKFEYYDNLNKKEKEEHPEQSKPVKKQFIANDITLEALVDLHGESDNAVGVFKDELAGWFKDMNKYRDGSDKEFWLSCWSSSPVILTRVTRRGSYIERPCIPVLGGIQPGVLTEFNTTENRENGFMDRMLLCYPELKSQHLSKERMSYDSITWYNDKIISFFDIIRDNVVKRDAEGLIEPLSCKMSKEAFKVYDKRHFEITEIENDDHVNEYLKSMLPKQKAYIARFALIIHVFNDFFTDNGNALEVSEDSVNKAIRLSDYFIETAKKVKIDSQEVSEIKTIIDKNKNKTNLEKFTAIYKVNPDVDKKQASQQLDVSLQMIYKYIKNIK